MNESSESESSGCESSTSERKHPEGPMSMDEGYVSKIEGTTISYTL